MIRELLGDTVGAIALVVLLICGLGAEAIYGEPPAPVSEYP